VHPFVTSDNIVKHVSPEFARRQCGPLRGATKFPLETTLLSRAPAVGSIVTFHFGNLIVEANDQQSRHPLRDEVPPLALAGHLTQQRQSHGADGNS
jgi:hypothetical protein